MLLTLIKNHRMHYILKWILMFYCNTNILLRTLIKIILLQNLICCISLGTRSIIYVVFALRRHVGYFLIQLYVPCILIVFLSWVGLWLNREATNDRINLGIIYFFFIFLMIFYFLQV